MTPELTPFQTGILHTSIHVSYIKYLPKNKEVNQTLLIPCLPAYTYRQQGDPACQSAMP